MTVLISLQEVDQKLPDVTVVTPESSGNYVQFALGEQSWKSSDDGHCSVGGWDPQQSNPAVSRSFRDWLV